MPRSLSHQVGILTLGRLLSYAVMFFVPLVNVRTLTLEHYGYYRQFWLIFDTLTPLLILGIPRSLLFYFPRLDSREDKSVYVTQTLIYLTVASLVAVAVYTVMGRLLGQGLGDLVRAFYLRLCFFTFFMVISNYMDSLFVAEKQVVRQSIYHVSSATVQAVIVIVSSLLSHDVNVIIWALAWFSLAKFTFAAVYTWVVYRPSFYRVSMESVKDQMSFALPLGMASIALVLLSQTDKFIINRFLGREEFAIYSVGAYQVPFVNIIRTSINNVTFPLMSQYQKVGDSAAIMSLWQRALLRTAVLFFPLFAFLMIAARPFIHILFTDAYIAATPIFMIYLFLFLRSTVETGAIIQVYKKTAYIARVFFVGFFVNLVLSLALFKAMGRSGVPLGTVITMYGVNAANLFYASRLLGVSLRQLFPSAEILKRLGLALAPGVALWFVFRLVRVDNIYELAASGIGYMGVYFGLCAAIGYITIDDVKSLLGRKVV